LLGVSCVVITAPGDEVRNLARPHPGPLPQGEGESPSVGQRIRCGRNPQASSLAVPSSEGERQREWKHSDTIPPFTLRPPRFDRVLVDAPCSNTGVMRRRVDLRWRVRLEEIQRLQRAQLELLRQAAQFLNTGGTLVYSTCSLEREENQEVITQFLSEYARFKL